MKYLLLLTICILFVFSNTISYSTCDIYGVNDITKEYHLFTDQDNYWGIGWHSLGERGDEIISKYIQLHYTQAFFPYKIEITVMLFFIAVILIICLLGKKRKFYKIR